MSDYTIHQEEYRGFNIRIEQDLDAGNPYQEFDFASKMVVEYTSEKCLYALLEEEGLLTDLAYAFWNHDSNAFESRYERELTKAGYVFDYVSGNNGNDYLFYMTPETIKTEFGHYLEKAKERAENLLKAEIKTFRSWLDGECYGYILESKDGEQLDSCWGFYEDIDYPIEQAKSQVDYWFRREQETEQFVRNHFAL